MNSTFLILMKRDVVIALFVNTLICDILFVSMKTTNE